MFASIQRHFYSSEERFYIDKITENFNFDPFILNHKIKIKAYPQKTEKLNGELCCLYCPRPKKKKKVKLKLSDLVCIKDETGTPIAVPTTIQEFFPTSNVSSPELSKSHEKTISKSCEPEINDEPSIFKPKESLLSPSTSQDSKKQKAVGIKKVFKNQFPVRKSKAKFPCLDDETASQSKSIPTCISETLGLNELEGKSGCAADKLSPDSSKESSLPLESTLGAKSNLNHNKIYSLDKIKQKDTKRNRENNHSTENTKHKFLESLNAQIIHKKKRHYKKKLKTNSHKNSSPKDSNFIPTKLPPSIEYQSAPDSTCELSNLQDEIISQSENISANIESSPPLYSPFFEVFNNDDTTNSSWDSLNNANKNICTDLNHLKVDKVDSTRLLISECPIEKNLNLINISCSFLGVFSEVLESLIYSVRKHAELGLDSITLFEDHANFFSIKVFKYLLEKAHSVTLNTLAKEKLELSISGVNKIIFLISQKHIDKIISNPYPLAEATFEYEASQLSLFIEQYFIYKGWIPPGPEHLKYLCKCITKARVDIAQKKISTILNSSNQEEHKEENVETNKDSDDEVFQEAMNSLSELIHPPTDKEIEKTDPELTVEKEDLKKLIENFDLLEEEQKSAVRNYIFSMNKIDPLYTKNLFEASSY